MRAPLVSLVFAVCACAPQASTIPKLSVGNTGCTRGELAIFNYVPEQRTWTAVCQRTVYACSSVGGGNSRCSPAVGALQSAETLRRANVIRSLKTERADMLLAHDVSGMDRDVFIQTVALLAVLPADVLPKIDDPVAVVLVDPSAHKLDGCLLPSLFTVKLARSGKPRVPNALWCTKAIGTVTFDQRLYGKDVQVFRGVTDEAFKREIERVRAIYNEDVGEGTDDVLATTSGDGKAATSPDATQSSTSALAAADEATVRAKLDAIGPDWLACLGADRSVAIASVDGSGHVSVRAREVAAADPVQGCVRALFGELSVSTGPGEVVHLLRLSSPRPAAAGSPDGAAPR